MKCSPDHPRDVRVHRRHPALEREARYGARSVAADTRQRPELRGIGREHAFAFGHYDLRQLLQVLGAPIIPESFPALAHLPGRGGCKLAESRICLYEATIVADH